MQPAPDFARCLLQSFTQSTRDLQQKHCNDTQNKGRSKLHYQNQQTLLLALETTALKAARSFH